MSMSTTQESVIPLYEEVISGFNHLSASGSTGRESSDLRRTRQSAFEKFRLLGFPTIKNEDWKYTNLARFLKDEFALQAAVTPDPALLRDLLEKATIPSLDCYQVVLVNGSWLGEVKGGPLPKGIELLTVAAARQDPALSVYFERAEWNNQPFAHLNTALFTDGLFIRADAGAVADRPLHVVHLFTAGHNLFVQPRHVWVINRNAELSVIESVISGNGAGGTNSGNGTSGATGTSGAAKVWVNALTEIIVHTDARLDHTVIQTAGAGIRLNQHTTVRQKRQSLYNNYTFTLPGADLVRNDLQARLEEDHTESHLYGLYLVAGQQLIDNHTLVDHQKPFCFSNELYKGVMLEQSTGVFNGKVYVHKDAQKTNAFQQNNNLVISKKATIDSKPELEIFADDVKCSHGSTVGQFSEDALFYLRARGIGESTAKALLINAFAFDVTEKIKFPAVETYINELISHHIPIMHA
jgi:Fe-S cluster assembly protein SufD